MRNLFLALLFANLAFAAWQAWLDAPPEPSAVLQDDQTIVLVSEVENGRKGDRSERDDADPRAHTDAARLDPRAADAENSASADGDSPAVADAALAADTSRAADAAGSSDAESETSPPADSSATETADVSRAADSAAAASPAPRCVTVGPFAELSAATTASATLRAAGYMPQQRVAEGDIWVGLWVHIPDIPTRAEARTALDTLHGNGVEEAYLIPGEEDGDIISLGVFSQLTRAGRLRDDVRALGLDAVVVDRYRTGTVYWIDVMVDAAGQIDLGALQAGPRTRQLEQRDCTQSG